MLCICAYIVVFSYPTLKYSHYYNRSNHHQTHAQHNTTDQQVCADSILNISNGRNATDFRLNLSSKDTYYRQAKQYNYRARSAYKLIQIHQLYNIFHNVHNALDLCGAPGSWSQVLSQYIPVQSTDGHTRCLVSVDLQSIAPINGVHIIQGDITDKKTCMNVLKQFNNELIDLIVCDGAPDVTGIHTLDEYLHSQLMIAAYNFIAHSLKPGGCYVAKLFKSHSIDIIINQYRQLFDIVHLVKPSASRTRSAEHFIVCIGYNPPDDMQPIWLNVTDDNHQFINSTNASQHTKQLMKYFASGSLSNQQLSSTINPTSHSIHHSNQQQTNDKHPYLQYIPDDLGN